MVIINSDLWESLLPELWSEIFLRLSIKDVLICKAISKFFWSIIDDPNFAVLYFHRHINDPIPEGGGHDNIDDGVGCQNCNNPDIVCNHVTRTNVIVIDRPTNDGVIKGGMYVTKFGDILTPIVMFEFPGYWGSFKCDVVGTINGLLLLHKYESRRKNWNSRCELILWNPITGKTSTIPKSPLCLEGGYFVSQPVKFGFGYDADNDDYKIVALALSSEKPEYTASTEVYSLRTKSWKLKGFCLERALYFGPKLTDHVSISWMAGEVNPNGLGSVDYNIDGEGEDDSLDGGHEEDVNFDRMIHFHLRDEELYLIKSPHTEEPNRVKIPLLGNKNIHVKKFAAENLVSKEWYAALRGRRVSNAIRMAGNLLISVHGRGLFSYIIGEGGEMDNHPIPVLTHHLDADFMDAYVPTLLSPSNPLGSSNQQLPEQV